MVARRKRSSEDLGLQGGAGAGAGGCGRYHCWCRHRCGRRDHDRDRRTCRTSREYLRWDEG